MVGKSISENQNKKRKRSRNSNCTALLYSFSDCNEGEGFSAMSAVRKVFGINEVHHLCHILNLEFER